jgi:PAS domain S-box-containing protein
MPEKRQVEEALQITDSRIANILESITDAFVAFDRQWRYTYVNAEAARMLQRSSEELLGKHVWQEVFPEYAQVNALAYQELHRAVAEQVSVKFENFSLAANRWLEVSAFPFPDGLAVYFRDISDRKRAERRLAAQHAVTRILAETATLADAVPTILQSLCESLEWPLGTIWSVDRQAHVLRCINSWHAPDLDLEEFVEVNQHTTFALNMGLAGRIWASGQPAWISDLTKDNNFPRAAFAAKAGLRGAFGFPILLKNEILGIIECFSDQVQAPDDDLLQMMAAIGSQIGQFIERKRVELEREQLLERERAAREEAEAANRIKDKFLAVLSHELRSPLNPILGWTKLLRSRSLNEEVTDRALETIERNAKIQTQLIDDLLDVSRILQGKMVLNVCSVNLEDIIEAALETVQFAAKAKDIQLQTVLAGDVGQIAGDPVRLQQVVWNLLSNAVKFTHPTGRVVVRLERVGSYAQIQVKDTGQGISPDFLPYIFDYFRQADTNQSID